MILVPVWFFFEFLSLQVTYLPPKKAANLIKQQTPDRPLPLSFAAGQTRFGTFPIWISKDLRAVPQVTSIDGPPSGGVLRGRHQREHVLEVDHLL